MLLNLVSRLTRGLEGQCYVERLSSARDRRVTLVRATAAGEEIAREIGDRARVGFASLRHRRWFRQRGTYPPDTGRIDRDASREP